MDVTYSADIEGLDEPLFAAAQERPGLPVRVRVQPSLWRRRAGDGGNFAAWKGVSWTVACATPEEAVALRESMATFFAAVGRLGPGVARLRLQAAMDERPPTK